MTIDTRRDIDIFLYYNVWSGVVCTFCAIATSFQELSCLVLWIVVYLPNIVFVKKCHMNQSLQSNESMPVNVQALISECPDFSRWLYRSMLLRNKDGNYIESGPIKNLSFSYKDNNPEYYYEQGVPETEGLIGDYYDRNNASYPKLLEELKSQNYFCDLSIHYGPKFGDVDGFTNPWIRSADISFDTTANPIAVKVLLRSLSVHGVRSNNHKKLIDTAHFLDELLPEVEQVDRVKSYVLAKSKMLRKKELCLNIGSLFVDDPRSEKNYFSMASIANVNFYEPLLQLEKLGVLKVDRITLSTNYALQKAYVNIVENDCITLSDAGILEIGDVNTTIPIGQCCTALEILIDCFYSSNEYVSYDEFRLHMNDKTSTEFNRKLQKNVIDEIRNHIKSDNLALEIKNIRGKGYYLEQTDI